MPRSTGHSTGKLHAEQVVLQSQLPRCDYYGQIRVTLEIVQCFDD